MNKFHPAIIYLASAFTIFVISGIVFYVRAETAPEVIHACVMQPHHKDKKDWSQGDTGDIRIVAKESDCRKNEMHISWNAQGPMGPQGPAGPPGPEGPPGSGGSGGGQLMVVDSQGQEVGYYNGGYPIRQVNGQWITLQATTRGYLPLEIWVSYESNDCSGTPLMNANDIARRGTIVNNTVYYPGDPLVYHFNSSRVFIPPSSYGECIQESANELVGPLQSAELPVFVPPFSIIQN